ncbi:MAG TPA: AAA family ATPase [Tepidisphaeraceae bacterium]|jgi:hypothetical protein
MSEGPQAIDVGAAMRRVHAGGISVVPTDMATKKPRVKWKHLQVEAADTDTVEGWARRQPPAFAAICGKVSGGLLILDSDVPRLYEAWRERVGHMADGLPVQRTGGGGYHVGLRCDNPRGNQKLAWVFDEDEPLGRSIGIETRGEGGYSILAPSWYSSGNRYEMLSADFASVPKIPQEQADALIEAAQKLDEYSGPFPKQRREQEAQEDHRNRASVNGQASVIDAFNDAHDIESILSAHGYTKGVSGMFARPGRERHLCSVTVRDGRSFHHSTNDPLNDGYWHRPFDIFCKLEHGGDCKAAVKDAAAKLGIGHGERGDNQNTKNLGITQSDAAATSTPLLVRVSDVLREKVEWLMPGRIPIGKLTMYVGDPGLGKSFVTTDHAGRITRCIPWPDGSGTPQAGSVIFLSAEDDVADTIGPRLDAAQADTSKVFVLQGIKRIIKGKANVSQFSLDRDLPHLEAAIVQAGDARLVVIDPISAYIPLAADSHNNAEVRALLAPLATLAQKRRVAILLVSHLNKGAGAAIYRAMGSLAFVAACRAVFAFAKDKADPRRRIIVPIKNNLAADTSGLAYSIVDGQVAWEAAPVTQTADEILSSEGDECSRNELDEAVDWLRKELFNGPQQAKELKRRARADGIAERTLERAKSRLKVVARPDGYRGPWVWTMPETATVRQNPYTPDPLAVSGASAELTTTHPETAIGGLCVADSVGPETANFPETANSEPTDRQRSDLASSGLLAQNPHTPPSFPETANGVYTRAREDDEYEAAERAALASEGM